MNVRVVLSAELSINNVVYDDAEMEEGVHGTLYVSSNTKGIVAIFPTGSWLYVEKFDATNPTA